MSISRRDFLKVAGLAAGSALAFPQAVSASPRNKTEDHLAMLYDATICVGCNACTNACRQWNETTPETRRRATSMTRPPNSPQTPTPSSNCTKPKMNTPS